MKGFCKILLVVGLCFLTACGTGVPGLTNRLVQQAIALEIRLTQAELNQQLGLKQADFEVKHVTIKQVESLSLESAPTYRVQGSYDLTLKLPKRLVTEQKNTFDLYLQPQVEYETWRLARLEGGDRTHEPTWGSYLIEMPS